MKHKLLAIAALSLLFTPVTTLTMPNPAAQGPGKWDSYRQMMKYHRGLEKHGLAGTVSVVEIAAAGRGRTSIARTFRAALSDLYRVFVVKNRAKVDVAVAFQFAERPLSVRRAVVLAPFVKMDVRSARRGWSRCG